MTKGELMILVYGENYTGIDTAIPVQLWDKIETWCHVVNYNEKLGGHSGGKLQNMVKYAIEQNIQLPNRILEAEYDHCCRSDKYFYNNYCRKEGEPFYTEEVFAEYLKRVQLSREIMPEKFFPRRVYQPLTEEDCYEQEN